MEKVYGLFDNYVSYEGWWAYDLVSLYLTFEDAKKALYEHIDNPGFCPDYISEWKMVVEEITINSSSEGSDRRQVYTIDVIDDDGEVFDDANKEEKND